jgi:hypothetical protein
LVVRTKSPGTTKGEVTTPAADSPTAEVSTSKSYLTSVAAERGREVSKRAPRAMTLWFFMGTISGLEFVKSEREESLRGLVKAT